MRDILKTEMPKVEVIKADKRSIRNPHIVKNGNKLRVAAYCRVSTDDEQQQTSYIQQKEYYSSMINKNPEWQLVDIYADKGLSGTTTKHRKEFQRMMRDAEDGKIDLILTKSISRFARNTIDTLSWVQRLRNLPNPVQVRFEKEGFESFDFGSEMLLTIMSAFAQAESRSISENVKWSLQKNFANGKPTINLNRMLGYDYGQNGEWVINKEQAAIIREIYNMYLCGVSAHRISVFLNDKKLYTINGNRWTAKSVLQILCNEKYAGDLIMQKSVTVDMLSHTVIKNNGIAKQYYVKDHHPPIIDRTTWDKVQNLTAINSIKNLKIRKKDKFAVLSNLYCGTCGESFIRTKYSSKVHSLSNTEEEYYFSYPVLKCSQNNSKCKVQKKLDPGEKRCDSAYLYECGVLQAFMEELYRIKADIIQNDNNAEIIKAYYSLCLGRAKEKNSFLYRDYTETTKKIESTIDSIKELTENQLELDEILGEKKIFQSIISEYESQNSEFKKHRDELLTKIIQTDSDTKKFEYFINSVLALSDKDTNGNKLNIQTTNSNTSHIYDLLPFNKTFYLTFIENGTVYGDVVEYKTKFGVSFTTKGNTRKMADFIGYRTTDKNGDTIIIHDEYEVVGKTLQHRQRKKR